MPKTCKPLLSRLIPAALLLMSGGAPAQDTRALQSHATIREQVHDFLLQRAGSPGAQVEIRVDSPDPRLRLTRCEQPLEVFLPLSAPPAGRVTVGVRCRGEHAWNLYLAARVKLFDQVVVVSRELARGERIPRTALALERRDLAREHRGYFQDVGQVAGQQARRRISRGTVVNPGLVKTPEAIRRGALVNIVSRVAGIEARMRGKALEHGGLGQRIRVENLSSGRELEARIVTAGTVRVDI